MSDVVIPPPTEPEVAKEKAATRKNTINMLWEYTQAFLAISLTLAAIYVSVRTPSDVPQTLENALFVVIGFYFGRTNHARPVLEVPEDQP